MAPSKFINGHSDRIIKVCGNKIPENIGEVAHLAPMLMGFIFYEKSPRSALGLDAEAVKSLPPYIRPVGVFVNEQYESIEATCKKYGINIVQLHGNESPALCKELSDQGYIVIKATAIKSEDELKDLKKYEDEGVTMFLFDTPTPNFGGSGKKFNWEILKDYPLSVPYLLSGGIGEEDTEAIIQNMYPMMAGIDINSKFESAPGLKDIRKLTHFILSLRQLNEHEPTGIPFWEKK